MKYVPTPLPEENVNISKRSPLWDLTTLLGGALLSLLLVYWLLGFAVDYYVPRLSLERESQLGQSFTLAFEHKLTAVQARKQAYLQNLMNTLVKEKYGNTPHLNYRIHLNPEPEANAFAFPGGHIVVMEGLVDQASSENELVFVLGHEMGHLHYRHNLRAMGRSLIFYALTEAAFGGASGISKNVSSFTQGLQYGFSRAQELEADHMGIEANYAHYHHVGGALAFLTRHQKAAGFAGSQLGQYFASHPHPEGRIDQLKVQLNQNQWTLKPTTPLPTF
jgi:predicted Zn-dependent protease